MMNGTFVMANLSCFSFRHCSPLMYPYVTMSELLGSRLFFLKVPVNMSEQVNSEHEYS